MVAEICRVLSDIYVFWQNSGNYKEAVAINTLGRMACSADKSITIMCARNVITTFCVQNSITYICAQNPIIIICALNLTKIISAQD